MTLAGVEQDVLFSLQEVVAKNALVGMGKALRERGISLDELKESSLAVRDEFAEDTFGLGDGRGIPPASCCSGHCTGGRRPLLGGEVSWGCLALTVRRREMGQTGSRILLTRDGLGAIIRSGVVADGVVARMFAELVACSV